MREFYTLNWLPDALVIGVTEEQFWRMNPTKLEPYRIAFEIREERKGKEIDYIGWLFGLYNEKAFSVPLTQFAGGLSHKKIDVSYFKTPFSQQAKAETNVNNGEGELSEAEKIRRTELLFASLNTMAMNYKLEKGRGAE